MKTDWAAVREAYITEGGSYRELAEQYGVGVNAVKQRGSREGWVALRQQARETGDGQARRERFLAVTDKLVEKVALLTDREELITAANLKTLSDVMKNIKEAQMLRSPKEQLELDMRIEKLKKETGREDTGTAVTVRLEETAEFAR